MLSLRELQRQFVEKIKNHSSPDLAIENSGQSGQVIRHCEERFVSPESIFIKQSTTLSTQERLTIYRTSIRSSLLKTLREVYSVCCKLVGKDFFDEMARRYIQENPSDSPNLSHYGAHFPEFTEMYEPVKSLPYLPDVARLEWAWHEAFNSPNASALDFLALQQQSALSPDAIVFQLAPGSTLIKSLYPIHRIFEVNQDTYEGDQTVYLNSACHPERREGSLENISCDPSSKRDDRLPKQFQNAAFYFLIWRNDLEMRIDLLDEIEWQILHCIKNNLTMERLCNLVSTSYSEHDIINVLGNIVQKKWLTDFYVENTGDRYVNQITIDRRMEQVQRHL